MRGGLGTRLAYSIVALSPRYIVWQAAFNCSIVLNNLYGVDRVDRVLAGHYGFTAEELDFIIDTTSSFARGESGDNGLGQE